ncbi:hypothetical protein GCM10011579_041290 [Streptomyces albiflavescens]|uniref:Uncharacterized protein n=1 Tax=Streptomyces albiflavescens TaxID=1623582 RepID=A0A917Y7D6_9ACTN|nr:hypothetical protein GCM10011579_041290 [Streptomyces albiflavescens]
MTHLRSKRLPSLGLGRTRRPPCPRRCARSRAREADRHRAERARRPPDRSGLRNHLNGNDDWAPVPVTDPHRFTIRWIQKKRAEQ